MTRISFSKPHLADHSGCSPSLTLCLLFGPSRWEHWDSCSPLSLLLTKWPVVDRGRAPLAEAPAPSRGTSPAAAAPRGFTGMPSAPLSPEVLRGTMASSCSLHGHPWLVLLSLPTSVNQPLSSSHQCPVQVSHLLPSGTQLAVIATLNSPLDSCMSLSSLPESSLTRSSCFSTQLPVFASKTCSHSQPA